MDEWPSNAAEAIALQRRLTGRVSLKDERRAAGTIAGIDCSFDVTGGISFAVVTVMDIAELEPVVVVRDQMKTSFPYISGLLSFREIPVILRALRQLPRLPDLLMVDGQGIAHPRRLGIAAHLGVFLDHPTLGVAKSRLWGTFEEPGPLRGSFSPLMDKGERIGTVLRSRDGVKPLFVSPGHRISVDGSLDVTLRCLRRHRLPEPTRLADKISKDKPKTLGSAG